MVVVLRFTDGVDGFEASHIVRSIYPCAVRTPEKPLHVVPSPPALLEDDLHGVQAVGIRVQIPPPLPACVQPIPMPDTKRVAELLYLLLDAGMCPKYRFRRPRRERKDSACPGHEIARKYARMRPQCTCKRKRAVYRWGDCRLGRDCRRDGRRLCRGVRDNSRGRPSGRRGGACNAAGRHGTGGREVQ